MNRGLFCQNVCTSYVGQSHSRVTPTRFNMSNYALHHTIEDVSVFLRPDFPVLNLGVYLERALETCLSPSDNPHYIGNGER